jgi:hypothetical protein
LRCHSKNRSVRCGFFISGYCWQLHRIGRVWRTHLPFRFDEIAISGEYIAFYAYSQRKCWALKYTPGSIFTLFLPIFACLRRVLSKAGVSDRPLADVCHLKPIYIYLESGEWTMTEPTSVNEALEYLPEFVGKDVLVQGILHFQFEDVALYHHPVSERKDGYRSSIWLEVGSGSLNFNVEACTHLDGKLVYVRGKLFEPDPTFGGCGHMSLWPAALLARALERA